MKSSLAFSSVVGFGLATAQSVTTSIPPATGTELSDSAIVVSGSFDGGMKFYDRSRESCPQIKGSSLSRERPATRRHLTTLLW